MLAFLAAGLLSYLYPIPHQEGVGVWAFYLALVLCYTLYWLGCEVAPAKRLPAGPTLFLGFLSLAIPDMLLTFERFGVGGTVGGMGINDGLIRFWLVPALPIVLAWVVSEWIYARDKNLPFSWVSALRFHIKLTNGP